MILQVVQTKTIMYVFVFLKMLRVLGKKEMAPYIKHAVSLCACMFMGVICARVWFCVRAQACVFVCVCVCVRVRMCVRRGSCTFVCVD